MGEFIPVRCTGRGLGFLKFGGGRGGLVACTVCCRAQANSYFLRLSEKGVSHDPDFDKKWDGFKKILQGNLEITAARMF